jgi:hypothetical protein
VPPSQQVTVTQLIDAKTGSYEKDKWHYSLQTPEIQLHCPDERCNGTRFFRCVSGAPRLTVGLSSLEYLRYKCWNCQRTIKVYSVLLNLPVADSINGDCYKLGELPVYGPPTPSRLISLIGPVGIGAFVYYRRVVENQKHRILDAIINVSEKLGTPPESIEVLKHAQAEQQFKKAVESVKDALPQVLLINSQNPLTLLHSALSEGLHARSDEECLEIAQAVRVVLGELAERLGQAMKDEAEVKNALARLMKKH